jgi:hypothetical protein
MLSTKYLIKNIKDVPDVWIYENYCSLDQKLTGQDIKIKSIFNPSEKTPSMCIYFKNGKYLFKDFSTGKGGNAINLVQELYSEKFAVSCFRIEQEYNKYIMNNNIQNKIVDFKTHSKYKVTDVNLRNWCLHDKIYWQKYCIGSDLLEKHNIKPIESYTMEKYVDDDIKKIEIKNIHMYGYYTDKNVLYKIYQPKLKEYKFIKLISYLQGLDQLHGHPYLIITSSLKDIMVLKSVGLKIDVIAPDSENTIIKSETIDFLQKNYKKVLTLFDNDTAGISAMKKYKELYNIDYIYFDLEKDVSDAVSIHGVNKTFSKLIPAINKKLN